MAEYYRRVSTNSIPVDFNLIRYGSSLLSHLWWRFYNPVSKSSIFRRHTGEFDPYKTLFTTRLNGEFHPSVFNTRNIDMKRGSLTV